MHCRSALANLPKDIIDTLNGYDPDQFQHVARYAEGSAEHKAHEAHLDGKSNQAVATTYGRRSTSISP